jgi:hypothetical protein
MKAIALIIVLAVTAIVLFSAVDAGRQSIVAHRDHMSLVEGL